MRKTRFLSLITVAVAVIFVLVGCSNKKTVTYTGEVNGIKQEVTLEAEGDKVVKQTAKSVVAYTNNATKEKVEAAFKPVIETYNKVKGVTAKGDFGKDKLTIDLAIDYKVASAEEVKEIAGGNVKGDVKKGISLKATEEQLKENGFKKK